MAGEHSETNPLFSGGSSGAGRLAIYLVVAVILMAADHRSDYLDGLRSRVAMAVYPLIQIIELPARAGRYVSHYLHERRYLAELNRTLEKRWLLAQARLSKLEALETENERLRELLDTSPRLGERVLIAELLSIDLDPYSHRVALNKGRRHGVYEGQPLADAGGIIGQVDQVGDLTAFAVLVSDPSHALPVVINRTGLRTIAYGSGRTDELVMRDVSSSANIQVGDLVVTSGLGGRFPPGYPVARVTEVRRDTGNAFLTVLMTPAAALDRSREVLLVWPQIPGERLAVDGESQ